MPTTVGQRVEIPITLPSTSAYIPVTIPDGLWTGFCLKCPGGLSGDLIVVTGLLNAARAGAAISGKDYAALEVPVPASTSFLMFGSGQDNPTLYGPTLNLLVCNTSYDPVLQASDTEFVVILSR